MMGWMQAAQGRAAAWATDLAQAPPEWNSWMLELSGAMMSGSGVRAVTYALILLVVGGSVEWLYWTYAYGPLRAVRTALVRAPAEALKLGLRRLALMVTGVLLFSAASIATSAGLSWPEGVHDAVVAISLWLMIVRLSWAVVDVLLSPGRRTRRLVPVRDRHVPWMLACALAVATLAGAARFLPDLVQEVGHAPHSAGALRLLLGTSVALILLIASFVFFARPAARRPAGRLPLFPRGFIVAAMVVGTYALWLLGSPIVSTLAIIVSLVGVLQMVLRGAVFHYWPTPMRESSSPPVVGAVSAPVGTGEVDEVALAPHLVLSALRFAVVAIGLGACAIALDTPLTELATRQGPLVRFAFNLLGVAALALLTNLVWIAIRSTIDRRLAAIGAEAVHGEPGPEARLLTLLPLLRMISALALLIMLVLSAL